MESRRDELFQKLFQKTEELGRQVTFSEMSEDERMPRPNDYAFYYGSFSEAAKEAYLKFRRGEKPIALAERIKEVQIMSKKPARALDPERTKVVTSEIVDMFIAADGQMPSLRAIKKNNFISETEVAILRENGELKEAQIRKMAEEKSGKRFLTPEERRRKAIDDAINNRKELIKKLEEQEVQPEPEPELKDELELELKDESQQIVSVVEEKEVKEEKTKRKYRRWSEENCKETLKRACDEAGHILSQAEVKVLSAEGKLPSWGTLIKKIGSRSLWEDILSEQSTIEDELEPETIECDDELEPETVECDDEAELEVVEHDDGTVEYPIKLILPKGIKGTIKLVLKF